MRVFDRSMHADENALMFDNGQTLYLPPTLDIWHKWFVDVRQLALNMRYHVESDVSAIACLSALLLVNGTFIFQST